MALPNRAQADWGQELSIDSSTFTGAAQSMGIFLEAPSILFIQNDSNVTVSLLRFSDSSQTGISFVAGTKIAVDLISNKANAEFFSFPANTPVQVSGAAGVGNFKIAYIHGKE